jgi:hypothetical protein
MAAKRPPKTTRKPIPQALRPWAKEVAGVAGWIMRAKSLEADYGTSWVSSQRRYYTARLCDLLNYAPRGKEALDMVRQYRAFLDNL